MGLAFATDKAASVAQFPHVLFNRRIWFGAKVRGDFPKSANRDRNGWLQ
jgi:hypothetical protein